MEKYCSTATIVLPLAVENGAARRNCNFTQDILNCYLEWWTRAAAKNGGTIDQCVMCMG